MPKMKTNSSAKKRFSVTGTGRLKRKQAFKNHILTKKSKKRKEKLAGFVEVHPSDAGRVKFMLGIGKGKA
jgi:large subunit ribosomal protein L35